MIFKNGRSQKLVNSSEQPWYRMLKKRFIKTDVKNYEVVPGNYNYEPNLLSSSTPSFRTDVIDNFVQMQSLRAQQSRIVDNVDQVDEESREEGYKLCSPVAKNNAKRILRAIYKQFVNCDYDFDVYPTRQQEVAVGYTPKKGHSLLILCDSQASVACFSVAGAKKSRFRHSDISDFCYDHLWQMLKQIGMQAGAEFEIRSAMELNTGPLQLAMLKSSIRIKVDEALINNWAQSSLNTQYKTCSSFLVPMTTNSVEGANKEIKAVSFSSTLKQSLSQEYSLAA